MDMQDLISRCLQVRQHAYAPYSHFLVGAAILTDKGIFLGCNVENASYGMGICAERSAVVTAVSSGAREIKAVVVSSGPGVSPCGICRQVLREFAAEDCAITCVNKDGEVVIQATMRDLLPDSFSPEHLLISNAS
jgi:cytidine deaminase